MREQALMAIEEADIVIFVVDTRDGFMGAEVAQLLRQARNRFSSPRTRWRDVLRQHAAEFYSLGLEEVFAISAEHGRVWVAFGSGHTASSRRCG